VQYPTLARSTVRHIELVSLSPQRLLVVLILSTGRVEQRVVEMAGELGIETLGDLRARILTAVVGERITDAAAALGLLTQQAAPQDSSQMAVIAAALVEAMSNERNDERVVVGGTANLARFGEGFDQSIKPMLEALEEHVVLLKLLGEASSPDSITVRIGAEGPYQQLATTSVVATGYGPGEEAVGSLGIVGPTRMDYPGSMAAVRAVARYVSTILDEA
jgi:heat-inducible transcriptional repressor